MIKRLRWWLFSKLIHLIVPICPQPQQSYFRRILGMGAAKFMAELKLKAVTEAGARRLDFRRTALHLRCRCNLALMYRLSELRWSKVARIERAM